MHTMKYAMIGIGLLGAVGCKSPTKILPEKNMHEVILEECTGSYSHYTTSRDTRVTCDWKDGTTHLYVFEKEKYRK